MTTERVRGVPRLCRHKGKGLAYATDPRTGREVYFGPWGEPEGVAAYGVWCKTLLEDRGTSPPAPAPPAGPVTVARLCGLYLDFAEGYYRKGGRPTTEVNNLKQIVRRLNARSGALRADAYGPKDLAALRDALAAERLSRNYANALLRRVLRVWRWGVAETLLPPACLAALESVRHLRKGRSAARETGKVRPVALDVVRATLPFLRPRLAALVLFQLYGAMRPAEAVCARPGDIDRTREPWEYRPHAFKTEHLSDAERVVRLGPQARAALAPWLAVTRPGGWLWPSRGRGVHAARKGHWTVNGYRRAVGLAVGRANAQRRRGKQPRIPVWQPRQLRKTMATLVRRRYGLEGSQAVLGHEHMETSEVYAEQDADLARRAAEELG